MKKRIELGTLSHGTMRGEDLIPCFIDEIRRYADYFTKEEMEELQKIEMKTEAEDFDWGSEEAGFILNEDLFEMLDSIAPPYCYFGSHEGDGSDYGFWISHDRIVEDIAFKELQSGDETPDKSTENGLFLHVNDHGNMTMYQWKNGQWNEVWSVV